MTVRQVTFRILRYKPNRITPPRFQDFMLEVNPETSILDSLEKIRLEQDHTLMYRHSCHHSACGTCACKVNGKEHLTCITRIKDLDANTIVLTPLEGFEPVGDLVVDMKRFYQDYSEDWSYLRKSEAVASAQPPAGIPAFTRFENCIECAACISACPVSRDQHSFIGPAVLAAINNELKKSGPKKGDLLDTAGSRRGQKICKRALNCSRVCPTQVNPARHIADLQRLLDKRQDGR
jgi:succinate dehydrogenase / fumarate reductase iron-sulfur subunit